VKIYEKGITHGGKFHADDVFSTAVLRMLCPGFTVKRVLSVPEDTDGYIVYDTGGGEFDHHGAEIKCRPDGRRYASFGLIWERYGAYLTGSEEIKNAIDEDFIAPMDESDNGGEKDMVSGIISAFNPPWNSDGNTDVAFEEAVDIAVTILTRLIAHEAAAKEADSEVREALDAMENGIVVLKRFAPWTKILVGTDALFVIYPSMRGGYNVQGVPISKDSRELRVSFPEKWCGLEDEKLVEASGIDGLVFCHRSGFLLAADTFEAALSAAEKAKQQ
jgi:uncharacterized UPF0160 family protein